MEATEAVETPIPVTLDAPVDSNQEETQPDSLKIELANAKLIEGKRHLICGDLATSSDCFQEALEIFVSLYGELAPECADAYYNYGCSLLNIVRAESEILTEAPTEQEEGDEEEEEEEEEEEGDDLDPTDPEGVELDGNDEKVIELTSNEVEEDGEVSTEQLAWEVMECARVIYAKTDDKLGLSRVYIRLGEHGLETGNHAQAVKDFSECLAIRKEIVLPFHRALAEVYYDLALALQFSDQFEEAIQHYENAANCIKLKMKLYEEENLSSKGKEKAVESGAEVKEGELESAPQVSEEEFKELESLLPEIAVKIEECQEEIRKIESLPEAPEEPSSSKEGRKSIGGVGMIKEEFLAESSLELNDENSNLQANDLSKLVKKKSQAQKSSQMAVLQPETPNEEVAIPNSRLNDSGEPVGANQGTDAEDVSSLKRKTEDASAEVDLKRSKVSV